MRRNFQSAWNCASRTCKMAADDVAEIKNLIEKLSRDTYSTTKKSLVSLAKLTKKTENVIKLRRNGGLELLLEYIKKPNQKLVDMALSVLANCSLETECRKQIRQQGGIAPLVLLLRNIQVTSILNRAARALANLAEDEMNAAQIERLEGIDELVMLLNKTSDCDCQQSVLRALRILCNTNTRKQILLNHNGVKTITSLLKSEKPAVVSCCVRTLAELTKDCSKEFAQQVQEHEGIKRIVEICESDRPVMQHAAVLILANLASHSHVRVCIGTEGGILAFYKHIEQNEPGHMTAKAVEGLCFCCREAVNRNKVRETGALELLMKLFSSSAYKHLHRKLVLAFTCFYYDDPSLEVLVNGGIVSALITHLNTIISNVSTVDEDEDDYSDQMSFTSDFSSPSASPRLSSNSFAADVRELATNSESSEQFLEKVETFANQVTSKESQLYRKTANFKRKSKPKVLFVDEVEGSVDMSAESMVVEAEDLPSIAEAKGTEGLHVHVDTDLPSIAEAKGTEGLHVHVDTDLPSIAEAKGTEGLHVHVDTDLPSIAEAKGTEGLHVHVDTDLPSIAEAKGTEGLHVHVDTDLPSIAEAKGTEGQHVHVDTDLPSIAEAKGTEGLHVHVDTENESQDLSKSLTENPTSNRRPISSTPISPLKAMTDSKPLCESPINQGHSGSSSQSHSSSVLKCKSLPNKLVVATPRNTSSSHLILPSPATPKSDCVFLTNALKRSPGHNAVAMLSRFSQMTDVSNILINRPCINVLLDYVSLLPHPSPRCERLLKGLTENPLCFEALVVNRAACDIHQQLCHGHRSTTNCAHNPDVLSNTPSTSASDSTGPILDLPCTCMKKDCLSQRIPVSSQSSCRSIGNRLLENLCTQAQTPYGKGALRHLLQRGSTNERQGCALTLPHICSTHRLRRDLLGERKGLRVLVDLLCSADSDELLSATVESLAVLSSAENIVMSCPTAESLSTNPGEEESTANAGQLLCSYAEDGEDIFAQPRLAKRFKADINNSGNKFESQGFDSLPANQFGACKHSTDVQGNFDLVIRLDTGELVPCHRQVLMKASEVFTAMLSNSYAEASQPDVCIRDVSHAVFSSALHLLYGCTNCVTICSNIESEPLETNGVVCKSVKQERKPEHHSPWTELPGAAAISNRLHLKFDFLIDLLAFADRFMLNELKTFSEEQLILVTDTTNVASACVHAKFYHANTLARFCLCYLLTRVPEICCRYRLFKELLTSKEKEHIVEDLHDLFSACFK